MCSQVVYVCVCGGCVHSQVEYYKLWLFSNPASNRNDKKTSANIKWVRNKHDY